MPVPLFLLLLLLFLLFFFFKLHAGEFIIAQTKAQRGGHLSYARFACVCVDIADTV